MINLSAALTGNSPRDYTPERYELAFRLDGVAPCVIKAHEEVQLFLNDALHKQPHRRRWLTLYGRSGAGKTHLARAAQAALRAHGWRVGYRRWGDALQRMLDGDWHLLRHLTDMPVLILDDIGAEYMESERLRKLDAAKLLELLEARLDKWTILTSNLRPREIGEQLDARIASRLYRGQNVLVDMTREAGAQDFGVRAYKERRGE